MADDLDSAIDQACAAYEKPKKILTCHVELVDAEWLCGDGGISLADLVWQVKEAIVADAIDKCNGSKVNAAEVLGISPQTLWNIERGNHK